MLETPAGPSPYTGGKPDDACLWLFYHDRAAGVTGCEGGGSPLRVCFEHPEEEDLTSPDGWPGQMPPPMPSERVASYLDRVIAGDSFLQSVMTRPGGLAAPSLAWVHPAFHSLEWWVKSWPDRELAVPSWVFATERRAALTYHVKRIQWRLALEMVAKLAAGNLVMKARRMDAASPLEVVRPEWWQNPFMVLRPHAPDGGWFRPEKRYGSEPPPGLPWYRELTLWPAKAAETKQKARPRVPYPKLLHWWTTEYLPRYPEPDKRPNVETQRTDAAAAFPDHAPPTELTMQKLRADKATPPEWREVGRRPNSE